MIEKRLKRHQKYTCSFLTLYEDDVILDNQKEAKRVVIKHPGGASVLPLTRDNHVILTKQFRYPIEAYTLEIPAGKKDDPLEDGLTCAKRELEEETGYMSDQFELMYKLHACLGYSDEFLDIYIAYNCNKLEAPKAADEDEHIEVLIYDKKAIEKLLNDGAITDGKTLVALNYYLRHF
mgnify:CR=1 FL=1